MVARKKVILLISVLIFGSCQANIEKAIGSAKVITGCSAAAFVASGLALALLRDKSAHEKEEQKPTSNTHLIKKGIYLTCGVSSLLGSLLTWVLSSDVEAIGSLLNSDFAHWLVGTLYYYNITGRSPNAHENDIKKVGRVQIGLRCLSVLNGVAGGLCLKRALIDDFAL